MPQRLRGLIAINFAALIFGSAALYGKLPISPLWLVASRAFFAALVVGGIGIIGGHSFFQVRRSWPQLLRSGLLLCLHWVTFFASVQSASIAIATLTFACFPLFSIALESLAQRRLPSMVKIIAGTVIILAVALLVGGQNQNLFGLFIGIASAFFFAAFGIVSKSLNQNISPLVVSFWQNCVVALALAPLLGSALPAPQTASHWGYLLLLGIVTTALMHQLYFYALARLEASTCSGFVALEPIYAIVLAGYFFGEAVAMQAIVSGLLILGASFMLFYWEEKSY
jgi:drug/metabolite transporter (DMT)-like permease